MVIQTFDTEYSVISLEKSKGQMPVYLCRHETDKELYQLFCMEKTFLSKETIAFLNEQLQNKNFDDFQDMFVSGEQFYVAMRYYTAPSLQDRLAENLEYEERLDIGKHVLEAFLLMNMPAFFVCQCLVPERLLISDSLEVHFAYTLDDVELAQTLRDKDCQEAFAKLMEILWKQELSNNTVPEIEEFLSFLRGGDDKAQERVYRNYLAMAEAFWQKPKEVRKKPRKILFLLWERVRKGIPYVKKILAVLILLATIGYLVYTVWEEKQPSGTNEQLIRYIGNLSVKE